MNKLLFRLSLIGLLFNFFISCTNQRANITPAYYYWKNSEYSLDDTELSFLKTQNIQKLYVKFFEVELDTLLGAIPTAKTELHIGNYSYDWNTDSLLNTTMSDLEIIPTIYIKNEVLHNLTIMSLDTLADNIFYLIKRYYNRQIKNTKEEFKEIQLDCDWTENTKENYFHLLRSIKEISKKTISCTLRLYPYKYRNKMGVPPVDKVVLMCYNLINPFSNEDKNSILDNNELESYLRKTERYPIHIDIALPVFSWMLVYQNNQFAGTINPQSSEINTFLKPDKPLWYSVTKDKEFDNLYLRPGDKVKLEDVTANTIKQSIIILKKYIHLDPSETIILFHLDSKNLNRFDNETICRFFSDFSN
jgi:hypothetical protein